MGEVVRLLPHSLTHARRARSIMLQNVGLSLGLITILLPLAAFGVLGLAAVVLVHEIAEIFVIGNGVRAGRARPLAPSPAAVATETSVPADAGVSCAAPQPKALSGRPPFPWPSPCGIGVRAGPAPFCPPPPSLRSPPTRPRSPT